MMSFARKCQGIFCR